MVIIEKTKPNSKDCTAKRKAAVDSSCNIGNLFRNRRNCFPVILKVIKQVPRRVEESPCLQILKLDWMSPWATDLPETSPLRVGQMCPPIPFNLTYFVIL